jgi:hypothetical protein
MQTDYIDLIKPTPKLNSKKCKALSFLLKIFLQYFIYLATFVAWYVSDYFIALLTLVLSYIIIGIIRSKLRNISIPINQQEYQYNDQGIADWFIAQEICLEEEIK